MATIRKVKRKKGVAYLAIIKQKGIPLKSKTFTRKGDAVVWVKRIEADKEMMESLGTRGACLTFADLVDEYIMQWDGKSVAAQHQRAAYWKTAFGNYKLADITANVIRDAIKTLSLGNVIRSDGQGGSRGRLKELDKVRTPATVNRYRAVLSAIFRYAVIEGYVPVNPVSRVPSKKVNNQINRYLDEVERQRLLTACKDSAWDRLHLAVLMAMTTGMRRGELINLRWCDIDFKRSLAMLADTKNGESRYCPIPSFVMAELEPLRGIGTGLIFPSYKLPGQPMEFKKHWDKALTDAEIVNFRWHDLRHTAASMLVQNGATLYETGQVLGHKSLVTTQRYAHLNTDHKSQLLERIMSQAVQL